MKSIHNFQELMSLLSSLPQRKRVAVACPHDSHTEFAIKRGLENRFAQFSLVVTREFVDRANLLREAYPEDVSVYTADDVDAAARMAVKLVRDGKADVLMKGLLNTDNLLHAVLDKNSGLLPKGNVLTHISVAQISEHPRLIFYSDAAVIPRPNYEQFKAMITYAARLCNNCGIAKPKVALIHCTEKISEKFPHTLDYVRLKEDAKAGVFGSTLVDGPMDVKTAFDLQSAMIKGLESPVVGNADVLIFPNIESGNTFYKTISLFAHADMASVLQGAVCPVVVTSRSDSELTKLYSLAMACLAV